MRFIVASIAALALLLLIARVSQAQAIEGRTCVPGEAILIEGTGPARTPLLLRFGGRAVGGGVSDAAGAYRLTLQMGQERPGDHLVVVEVRATGEELQRLRCTVPGGATPRPASSPAAPTAPPRPGAPTATIAPTARPTATISVTPGTVINGEVSPAWWPCDEGQIKGNRNSQIYHVPGGRSYARTYENVQCFDSAADAEAAGYRAAEQ